MASLRTFARKVAADDETWRNNNQTWARANFSFFIYFLFQINLHFEFFFTEKWGVDIHPIHPPPLYPPLHFRSSKEDRAWQSVLCCLQCLCWHFHEQHQVTTSNSTIAALLERGGTLFVSQNLQTWWDESAPATPWRWRSLCPCSDARLHPLVKWSVEPHLKQWSQLSITAVLHELHCQRRNCDWLPDA